MTNENSFQVISLIDEHTCVRHFKYGTLVNYKWIGKHFGTKIRLHPEIGGKEGQSVPNEATQVSQTASITQVQGTSVCSYNL